MFILLTRRKATVALDEMLGLYKDCKTSKITSSLIGGRKHAIGCALTCVASEKALVHRQTLSGNKERVQETL